ncbi:hypothetical protein J8273_1452 [Carpediemonas membranifera]|uniref:Regulator of chromosome condensation (RCC1) repeat-containing protein n=1 Tax=Carpediemonas membranifera TaxID=201153 RepID=A0A8J6C0D4_9EUKA|nr:hypothetical protein J8273_1452 [Carpediemonas membranifera]|eukprot:KAG9396471.1 hypothetical protein J8273_1452 [Carpediemonas membranifera]
MTLYQAQVSGVGFDSRTCQRSRPTATQAAVRLTGRYSRYIQRVRGLFYETVSDGVKPVDLWPSARQYAATLPAWHGNRVSIDVYVSNTLHLVLTPIGVGAAGPSSGLLVGEPVFTHDFTFRAVVGLPDQFIPSHVSGDCNHLIIASGEQQLVFGSNNEGQLGLGHTDRAGFVTPPLHIDEVLVAAPFNIYRSDDRCFYAGRLVDGAVETGLLPTDTVFVQNGKRRRILTPVPLAQSIKSFFAHVYDNISCVSTIVTVSDGSSTVSLDGITATVPFEVSAVLIKTSDAYDEEPFDEEPEPGATNVDGDGVLFLVDSNGVSHRIDMDDDEPASSEEQANVSARPGWQWLQRCH